MPADPNNAVQAFAAYADDRLWIASHLAQLVGIALALAALLILARQLETGGAAIWARLASAGTVASVALAPELQVEIGLAGMLSLVFGATVGREGQPRGMRRRTILGAMRRVRGSALHL